MGYGRHIQKSWEKHPKMPWEPQGALSGDEESTRALRGMNAPMVERVPMSADRAEIARYPARERGSLNNLIWHHACSGGLLVTQNTAGMWLVADGNGIVIASSFATNEAAWRWLDRQGGEPISKSEDRVEL
jgi:hypothetical protein